MATLQRTLLDFSKPFASRFASPMGIASLSFAKLAAISAGAEPSNKAIRQGRRRHNQVSVAQTKRLISKARNTLAQLQGFFCFTRSLFFVRNRTIFAATDCTTR